MAAWESQILQPKTNGASGGKYGVGQKAGRPKEDGGAAITNALAEKEM